MERYSNSSFFIFGFTSYVYEYLIKNLDNKKIERNFSKGTLIHGGGWKKMDKLKVNNGIFKKKLIKKINSKKDFTSPKFCFFQ